MLAAAQLQENRQQYEEARKLLEPLVTEYPGFDQRTAALYHLAWTHVELNQATEADAAFARVADEGAGTATGDATTAGERRRAADYATARSGSNSCCDRAEPDVRPCPVPAGKCRRRTPLGGRRSTMQRMLESSPSTRCGLRRSTGWPSSVSQEKYDRRRPSWLVSTKDEEPTEACCHGPVATGSVACAVGEVARSAELAGTIAARFPDFRQQYEVDYVLGRCLSSQARFSEAREAYQRVIRSPSVVAPRRGDGAVMIGETISPEGLCPGNPRLLPRGESVRLPSGRRALLQAANATSDGEWERPRACTRS